MQPLHYLHFSSLLPAIKDPIVLSWELKSIYTPPGRSEGLNGSADSSQPLLWEPLQLDSQGAAYGGLQEVAPMRKKRTRQRTMSSAKANALALAISDLSVVTLNLVHSRLCTSAHKINLFKPGQLHSASRQTKPR